MLQHDRRRFIVSEVEHDFIGARQRVRLGDRLAQRCQTVFGVHYVELGVDRDYGEHPAVFQWLDPELMAVRSP